MRDACRRFSSRAAFETERGSWTFAEVGDRIFRMASLFASLGVGPGEAVGVVVSRNPQLFYETRLATFEMGATLFGIAPALCPADLAGMLRSVNPRVVVYDANLFPAFPAFLAQALPKARALAAAGPAGDYEGLLAGREPRPSEYPVSPDALAAVGFTSGTTGPPKGVTATYRGMSEACSLFTDVLRRPGPDLLHRSDRGLRFFNAIPLFAAGGGMIVPSLVEGMTMSVPDVFEAARDLARMERERVAVIFMTPSMLIDLLDEPALDSSDLSSLRLLVYGSASTPAAKVDEAVRRLGPVLLQGYGMSECLPPVAVLWPEEHGSRERPAARPVLRSVGRPITGVRIRVVSERGESLPDGEIGEIAILSPTVTPGYWNDPQRTAESLRDGWWMSGDLGFTDAEGRVSLLDRKQDVLTRNGKRIFPRDIEEAVSEHPAVKEVCVVQIPGDRRIIAAVSLRRGVEAAGPSEIREFLGSHLEAGVLPDEIRILPALPRSVQGKVLKREVRDALAARSD